MTKNLKKAKDFAKRDQGRCLKQDCGWNGRIAGMIPGFADGFLGERVVIQHRKGGTWYMCGIQGFDNDKTIKMRLDFLSEDTYEIELISDGVIPNSFIFETRILTAGDDPKVKILPKGGFAARLSAGNSYLYSVLISTGLLT